MNQQQHGRGAPQSFRSETGRGAATNFPTERLGSFRPPRDLTLRGIGAASGSQRANIAAANKKVYTPNLNAIRNKNL